MTDPLGASPEDGTHVVCLLDQTANCVRQFSIGGLSPEIAEEMARHDSIIRTGYDPAFGRFRGEVEIQTCRDGICYSVTLNRPTLEQYGAYLNAAILWAAGPAGFAQAQLPQLARAGAGGAVVTLQWIVAGGVALVSTPVLVTAGVVAVVGVAGYYAWQYYKNREQRQVAEAARKYGLTYQELSEYLHAIKPSSGGRGPKDNFTFAELSAIAEELARNLGRIK